MTDNHKHDDMLFEMLKECKTLPNFFDEIFGFLQRRTDFYHIAKEPNAAVGLPEGLAEKIVKYSFYKSKPAPTESSSQYEIVQDAIIECGTDNVTEATFPVSCEKNNQKFSFTKSESYNGSVYENYCWSQTISDMDVIVKVPENISKKDIYVEILPSSLSIKLDDNTTLLSGELCEKCKANDAIWSIVGCKLEIHLDKCQEKWWNCLIKSEPNLDISKIDCSRPYEDLSEEAQAKIEELQWNQERKRLGLPTSDEISLHNTLKKAWGAEGSPFSGPFDPSAVCLN